MFALPKTAYLIFVALVSALIIVLIHGSFPAAAQNNCSKAYPDVCIAPPPPDLDCKDISYRNFKVVAPDPHKSFKGKLTGFKNEDGEVLEDLAVTIPKEWFTPEKIRAMFD